MLRRILLTGAVLILGALLGCSLGAKEPVQPTLTPTTAPSASATETSLPAQPPTPTDTPAPTATVTNTLRPTNTPRPTYTPRPTPTPLGPVAFPAWVSDPQTSVLLMPAQKNGDELLLWNAATGENSSFTNLPFAGFFWLPDGKQIGTISKDGKTVGLVNLPSGQRSQVTLTDAAPVEDYQTRYRVLAGVPGEPGFRIAPWWQEWSADGRYLYQELENEQIQITDSESGDTWLIENYPRPGWYTMRAEWAPHRPYLVISQADEPAEPYWFFASGNPSFRTLVYDAETREWVTFFRDLAGPRWSPDGVSLLYQNYWFYQSPPCVFKVDSGTSECFSDLSVYHKKSPDDALNYVLWGWLGDSRTVVYSYETFANGESRNGLCLLDVTTRAKKCILEGVLPDDNKAVFEFTLSSNNRYGLFAGNYALLSDDVGGARYGVVDLQTGTYFFIETDPWYLAEYAVWRP